MGIGPKLLILPSIFRFHAALDQKDALERMRSIFKVPGAKISLVIINYARFWHLLQAILYARLLFTRCATCLRARIMVYLTKH